MKTNNTKGTMKPEKILACIAETLIQQGDSISSPGLYHGNTGLVIFFFHYARYTGNPVFDKHAMALIEKIQEQIIQIQEIDYANGLAGIGTGIEYLVQNNFLEADTNEVLEDFDKYIFNEAIYGNHADAGLFTGLTGLGRYSLFRIAGRDENEDHPGILNNKMLLIHITDILDRMSSSLKKSDIEDVTGFLQDMQQTDILPVKIERMLNHFSSGDASNKTDSLIHSCQMKIEAFCRSNDNGIPSKTHINLFQNEMPFFYGGLAGIGLYLLSLLDKQHEIWMKLL